MPAVVGAVGEDLAHLARDQRDLGLNAADRHGREDRRDLQVVVANVVGNGLAEPQPLSGLAVERDERVGVEVGAGAARSVGELLGAVQRPRVGDRDEDAPLSVDRGRVPQAAAAVDLGVPKELGAVGDRVERPLRLACGGVEGPDDAVAVALVERLGVARDRADQDVAVVELGRHVDALVVVADQLLAGPQQLAGLGVEREGAGLGGAVEAAVAQGDAVRSDARLIERVLPLDLAGRAVQREDVRVEVLEVDGAVEGDRRRGEDAEGAGALEGEAPLHLQLGDGLGVDRRLCGGARVGQVVVVRRPRAGVGGPFRRRLTDGGSLGVRPGAWAGDRDGDDCHYCGGKTECECS